MAGSLVLPTHSTSLETPTLGLPVLARSGIRWTGGIGGRPLVVALEFENPTPEPTRATEARLQIADFGAFRAWRPLTTARVPSVSPFRNRIVEFTIDWRREALARMLRRTPGMGSDVHFVGNLNVFVSSRRPVERHVRRTIGLRPGVRNVSMFCVGDGRKHVYRFTIERCEPGWEISLGLPLDTPTELRVGVVDLTIVPPPKADTGSVAIGVEQISTDTSATVEFELQTTRLGSKCYFV